MKKISRELLILILFLGLGFFLYFYTPRSVVSMHQQINQSNPNDLDEDRVQLARDFTQILLGGMPRDASAPPKLYLFWIGNQRKLLDLRIEQAIEEIKTTSVEEGKVRIWSFLNMGVVIKTSDKMIAIDTANLPASNAHNELTDMADVFLITHGDKDHYDDSLLENASEKGIPLIFPNEFGFRFGSEGSEVYELESGEMVDMDGIKITAYQTDHRGDGNFNNPNAWYLLEIDGMIILHTGDGRDFKNKEEEEALSQREDIDIFLVNFMIHPFDIRGIKPKLAVPLHLFKFMHNREHLEQSTFDSVIELYDEYEEALMGIDQMLLLPGEGFEYSQ